MIFTRNTVRLNIDRYTNYIHYVCYSRAIKMFARCITYYMGRRGRDRMVVRFATPHSISAYHH